MLRRRRPPSAVVFVTRQGCHMCAEAQPVVTAAAADAGIALEVRDVDADESDRAQWTDHVPVVLLDGVVHSRWYVDEPALRKALRG